MPCSRERAHVAVAARARRVSHTTRPVVPLEQGPGGLDALPSVSGNPDTTTERDCGTTRESSPQRDPEHDWTDVRARCDADAIRLRSHRTLLDGLGCLLGGQRCVVDSGATTRLTTYPRIPPTELTRRPRRAPPTRCRAGPRRAARPSTTAVPTQLDADHRPEVVRDPQPHRATSS